MGAHTISQRHLNAIAGVQYSHDKFFNMISNNPDLITANYWKKKQTFIIPLTVENIHQISDDLEVIGYGGDVWTLRVDLLKDAQSSTAGIASASFVARQIGLLRQRSSLPIVFTLRIISQGGRFPDDATHESLSGYCLWP